MYQPEFETMSQDQIHELQLERLKKIAVRCYENVPIYHQHFDEAGFDPYSIKSLDDLRKAPFSKKQDLRDCYPYKMFAAPMDQVVRIHASSGTTGTATVVGYTKKDLDVWADCFARWIAESDCGPGSVMQISYGYGLFTGGLGAHQGGEKIGCSVIPISSGNTKRQIQIMNDFKVDLLACTPSYAMLLADTAIEEGYDPAKDFKVHAAICGAEPCTDIMRREIERKLGAKVLDIYGLSEVMGPGVACECRYQNGLHIAEDHFICEIIDPETLEPVPDGQWGELVFTTLSKECSPLFRYRTRDISRIIPGTCECGRSFRRIDKIQGRTDDMLVIRGVNVFPSQVEEVIKGFAEISPYYQVVVDTKGVMDHVILNVEPVPDFDFDEIRLIESLQNRIKAELKSNLQIAVDVHLVEPKTIERSEGKAKRVIDLRKGNTR